MKYLSSYYWQQEEPAATSLVLQHFVYRKGRQPGIFACICTVSSWKEGGSNVSNAYFAERLTCWFQEEGRELFRMDHSELFTKTRERLEQVISQIDEDLTSYASRIGQNGSPAPDIVGLLGMGERFLLFFRGEQKAYLLNKRFEHVHCKCLTESEKKGVLQIISGEMEKGIGILLTTKGFPENLSVRQMEECLSVKELGRTENVKGRLRELGEEAARQGGRHLGAVLLLTGKGGNYGE